MKLPLLVLFGSTLLAVGVTEENINKRFSVQSGGKIVVDVDVGSIEVSTHSSNEVVADISRKVTRKTKSAEEEYLRDQPVTISQDGNTVTIRCRRSGNGLKWGFWQKNEARYVITVPAEFHADVRTSGGPISVKDLTGDVKANTSGGGLHFSHLKGTLNGGTSGGGIHMADCEGPLKINTSGGGIEVGGGAGSLDGDTSGGPVTVKNFRGSVQVHTSGGGINVENVNGQITGSTSGGGISARFSEPVTEDIKLETSGGGVTVQVPDNSSFNLDAHTSGGSVSSDLPVAVTGKVERSHLRGPVNGGGKTVFLRSSGGSIRIKKS